MKAEELKNWFEKESIKQGKEGPYSSDDLIAFMKTEQLIIDVPKAQDPYQYEPVHNVID